MEVQADLVLAGMVELVLLLQTQQLALQIKAAVAVVQTVAEQSALKAAVQE